MIDRANGLMAASCGFPLPDSGGHTMEDVIYTLRIDGPCRFVLRRDKSTAPVITRAVPPINAAALHALRDMISTVARTPICRPFASRGTLIP